MALLEFEVVGRREEGERREVVVKEGRKRRELLVDRVKEREEEEKIEEEIEREDMGPSSFWGEEEGGRREGGCWEVS